MPEDSADRCRQHDGGNEPQAPAAVGALKDVDVETAPHELSPGAIVGSGDLLRGGTCVLLLSLSPPPRISRRR